MKPSSFFKTIFLLIVIFPWWCSASETPLTVGVFVSPPFVMKENDTYKGIAIDIWESAAKNKKIAYSFKEYETYTDLFNAVERKEIDAAVTNISITEERAARFDFSFPWYDSGLRIMTAKSQVTGVNNILNKIYNSGYLTSYIWIAGLIMLSAFLLTLFDRYFDKDFTRNWFNGIAESFYHVISLITTGKTGHKQLFGATGRIFAALWMLVGVAIIAYVTSSVTSVMTAMHFTDNITKLADLSGKNIAARTGSVSAQVLIDQGLKIYPVNHISNAIKPLQTGTVTAVIGDAPVLEYYVKQHPYSNLQVVGDMFHHDKFGFAFPQGSSFNREISLGIIHLAEKGTLSEIKKNYLGD
ncbi:glutamine ABC transporter periplasmic protein [Citrobacter freundii]|nr:glutamine ABC transporter periplasmic protein [Citrobacter freundii]